MTSIKKATKADGSKKVSIKEIEKELATALETLKPKLGDKKFIHRIKKAVKILTHGLDKIKTEKVKVAKIKVAVPLPVPVTAKKPAEAKKAAKKVTKK